MAGKQLSRTTSHRKALRRNMAASLFQYGAIRTTVIKAKELRSFVERIITVAKQGTLQARRRVLARLGDRAMADAEGDFQDKSVVQKLFDEVAPKYADRPGGYTRIIRLEDRRIGDAGKQVILQLVGDASSGAEKQSARAGRRRKRAHKRHEAAAAAAQAGPAPQEQAPQSQPDQDAEQQDKPAQG